MEFLFDYLSFLGKAVTIVVAIIVVIMAIVGAAQRLRHHDSEQLEIKPLNKRYADMRRALEHELLSPRAFKAQEKAREKQEKADAKREKKGETTADSDRHRLFVLDFDGDIRASATSRLREEITAVLQVATKDDEVLVRLESGGGMVHGYGLAASQLDRLRQRDIPLTVAVDKVAASGGYMMACVADRLLAAPFAIIGSIGVVMQLPNFHKLLKRHDIDFEMLTAGEHKRTLTVFGENTEDDRAKVREELEETHQLFKDYIAEHRPEVPLATVATGEHWYGRQALDLKLVDQLQTSDDYLLTAANTRDLYQLHYHGKRSFVDKLTDNATRAWRAITQG